MEYLSVFSPTAGKYGPEKRPYLDFFSRSVFSRELLALIAIFVIIPES